MMHSHRRKAPTGGRTKQKATAHKTPRLGSYANPAGPKMGSYKAHIAGTRTWVWSDEPPGTD